MTVLTAVIVGAGFGGIGMAIQLRKAGITDFTVLEKAPEVGGTWFFNTYPGAACDVPSPLYSYSFEQDFDWPRFYSGQADIRRYLVHCAQKHGVMPHVQLQTRVHGAAFDDARALWQVDIEGPQGRETLHARTFITATGQLGRPAWPDIAGLDQFAGASFHSAEWDHAQDLEGRRVGIIGTGASAIQFTGAVVQQAAHVTVFQRSAPYVLPRFDRRIGPVETWVMRHVPPARRLMRGIVYGVFESLGFGLLKWRPGLLPLRLLWWQHFHRTLRDPELRRKLRPDHELGCKRILFDSTYYRALAKPNVEVVTDAIERIGAEGVHTAGGREHKLDTLILATGFAASELLVPLQVRGRGGRLLHDVWRDGPQAYLGITVSGFPNLFMLYGPNTNLGHNSIIFMLESQIRYVVSAIRQLRSAPGAALDVRAPLQQRFNEKVQRGLRSTAWVAGCRSWYVGAGGRIVNNWSGFTVTYRLLTRRLQTRDYDWVLAAQADAAATVPEAVAAPLAAEPVATRIARGLMRHVVRPALHPKVPVSLQRLWLAVAAKGLPRATGVRYEALRVAGVPVDGIRARTDGDAPLAVLYLHGGAFMLGTPRGYRNVTARLARATGGTVWVPDYRLAPRYPFPAGLDDAMAVYLGLFAQGFPAHRIAVAGDSAGGGLALSLCLRLRDEGLALPACLALISPWADLGLQQLAPVADDPLLRRGWLEQGARSYLQGRHDAAEPLVSPLKADLAGLPPVLIHAAEHELLREDACRLHEALRAAGGTSLLRVFPGMWHDFQLHAGLVPQATQSLEQLGSFMARLCAETPPRVKHPREIPTLETAL